MTGTLCIGVEMSKQAAMKVVIRLEVPKAKDSECGLGIVVGSGPRTSCS